MLIGLFPEFLSAGGVQRAGRHTAAVLVDYARERGIPYRILSLNDPPGTHRGRVGEQAFRFQAFGRAKARFVLATLSLAFRKPKVVVAGHPNLAPVAWTITILAPRARFIVLTHGIEVWNRVPPVRRTALQRADLVLAPSTETARKLMTVQRVPKAKVRILPWGLDPQFTSECSGASHPLSTSPAGRVVLTVGRLDASEGYKGVDVLIESLLRLLVSVPDARLVVVGDGDDLPRLKRLTRRLGLDGRVYFLGQVSAQDLVAWYRRCDVFAMPSRGEGFGLVFLEAMAFGKPVVGGAHGGTLDIIEDGVTGFLVEHGNVEQLTQVLERLLTDDGLRKEMGRRARERVQSSYLFEHFQARLTQIVEELCVF